MSEQTRMEEAMLQVNSQVKKLLIAGSLLCGIAGAGSYAMVLSAQEEAAPLLEPVQAVSTLLLEEQSITLSHSLPGRITAYRQSDVRPQVDGIVTLRMFEEGAEVEKGQQLYQIDDTRYKAVLSSAVADLRSAQANLKAVRSRTNRYEELLKSNTISRQEYDDAVAALGQAQAAIGMAQAQVDLAKIDVDYTKVYAPISGRISRSFVSEGALVTANQAQVLATITALDPVYVDMQQSAGEQVLTEVHTQLPGDASVPVQLMLERRNGESRYTHTGYLKFSEVTMDQTTGATTLRAQIPNPEGYLLPGMFVRAVLDLGEVQGLLVPQRATTRTAQGELVVWVVDNERKARRRIIKADSAYQDRWVVSAGLKAGETIIIEGYQKVQDGQQVANADWTKLPTAELATTEGI
jgi:membrane fusion protein (multidrug efflux system)